MNRLHRILVLAATAAIAACGQVGGSAPASIGFSTRAATPPGCAGQRKTKKYAQLKVELRKRGGVLCVPEFHGFGGTIEYPAVERKVELILRSSIQNIYDEPQLGSGTAIFYLNLHFLAGTHFGAKFGSKGGLTAGPIEVDQPYTAFGMVTVGHLALMFPPCYAIATQGPYGGVLSGLGELFADTTITGAGYGAIEIYPGAQVSQQC